MTIHLPQGDLSRTITHEPDNDWPHSIEIRALWKTSKGGFRKKTVVISGDEFFGRASYGAPLTGDQVIGIIDRLRRDTRK